MLTDAELEERRKGVGGSEIAALFGMDPFKGALAVYLSKVEGYRPESNTDMERGSFLEDGIAQWYAHREGVSVGEPGPVVHPRYPVARCTPDRVSEDPQTGLVRLISIKAPRRAGDNWGETGGSRIPDGYVLQLQWEHLILSDLGWKLDPVMHLVALVEGDLRIYPVRMDFELQVSLLEEARAWWVRHVEARVPPPLDGSDDATAWLKRRFPKSGADMLTATLDDDVLLMGLKAAEDAEESAALALELAQQRLKERIGSAGGIEGSAGRVTWRSNVKNVRSFKSKWSTNTQHSGETP